MSNCPVCETKVPIIKAFSITKSSPYECAKCHTLLIEKPLHKGIVYWGQTLLLFLMTSFVANISVSIANYINTGWGLRVGGLTAVVGLLLLIYLNASRVTYQAQEP